MTGMSTNKNKLKKEMFLNMKKTDNVRLKARVFSFVLAIVMVSGLFPTASIQVFAADPFYISTEIELETISGSNHYILTDDIVLTSNWSPINGFSGTLDGGGHSITGLNIDVTTGAVPSAQYLGLFGILNGATIENLHVNGTISLKTSSSAANPNMHAGGIAGSSNNATFENVHFSGSVNVTISNENNAWAGGLVGIATNSNFSGCSNKAPITANATGAVGNTRGGGLCGEFSGTIENCFSEGNILVSSTMAYSYAGGLVASSSGTITKSYNSGSVASNNGSFGMGTVCIGGIVASGTSGSTVTNCAVMSPQISYTLGLGSGSKNIIAGGGTKSANISLNSISGSPNDDSNVRYVQAKMQTIAPYASIGWSFSVIWAINSGYPYLQKGNHQDEYEVKLIDYLDDESDAIYLLRMLYGHPTIGFIPRSANWIKTRNESFYQLITGGLQNQPDTEMEVKAHFLAFVYLALEANIIDTDRTIDEAKVYLFDWLNGQTPSSIISSAMIIEALEETTKMAFGISDVISDASDIFEIITTSAPGIKALYAAKSKQQMRDFYDYLEETVWKTNEPGLDWEILFKMRVTEQELRIFRHVRQLEESLSNDTATTVTMKCPVSVEVYNQNNELVAILTDGEEGALFNEWGSFYVTKDTGSPCYKKIAKLNSSDFSLVIQGLANGSMDYSVQTHHLNGTITEEYITDLPVTAQTIFTSNLGESAICSSSTNVGTVTTHNLNLGGQVLRHNISVSADNGGTAFGSDTVNDEAVVYVFAIPHSGYKFEGWYENNNLVSSDTTYEFIATTNLSLEARFEERSNGYISGSVATNNYQGIHVANVLVFNSEEVDWSDISNFRANKNLTVGSAAVETIQTEEDGTFSIELPEGEYDILIEKPGYLDYIITNITTGGEQTTDVGNVTIKAGDVNRDGEINTIDTILLTKYYLSQKQTFADPELWERLDLTEDGNINMSDLNALINNYKAQYTARTYDNIDVVKSYTINQELEEGQEIVLKSYISNDTYGTNGENGKQLAVEIWAKDLSINVLSMRLGFDSNVIVPSKGSGATNTPTYNEPVTEDYFTIRSLIINNNNAIDSEYNTVGEYMKKSDDCNLDLNNSVMTVEMTVISGISKYPQYYPNIDSDGNFITDANTHPNGVHLMTIYFQIKDEVNLTEASLYLAPEGQLLKSGVSIWGMSEGDEYNINNPLLFRIEGLPNCP